MAMWRVSRRGLAAARGRLVLTVIAIATGVAFVVAAGVISASLAATFTSFTAASTKGTDALARGAVDFGEGVVQPPVIDAAGQEALAAVDGVAAVAPEAAATTVVTTGADGEDLATSESSSAGLSSWTDDPELSVADIVEGSAPSAPGDVALDRATVTSAGLEVGDPVILTSAATVLEGRLAAVVTIDGQDGLQGVPRPFVTFDDAQRLAGQDGAGIVRVRGDGSVDQDELRDRVAAALPADGYEVVTGQEYQDELNAQAGGFVTVFQSILTGFAVIALLVASFLIANTFAMVVAQRRRELALLRAVGATRRQVRGSVLAEAFAVSLGSSVLGAGAGIGLGWLLLQVLDMVGFDLPILGLRVDVFAIVLGLVLGTGLGVAAAWQSVREATRVAPVEALRDAAVDRAPARGAAGIRVALGLLVLAAAVALVGWGERLDGPPPGLMLGVGAVAGVAAVVILNPVLARLLAPAMHRVLPGSGSVVARVARRNTARNPRRVAGTASALLIGLVVVVAASTVAASLQTGGGGEFRDGWADTDVTLTAAEFPVAEDLVARIQELPETGSVVASSFVTVELDGEEVFGQSVTGPVDDLIDLETTEGVSPGQLAGDQIAVAQLLADQQELSVGQPVAMTFPDGSERSVEVGGIYARALPLTPMVMPDELWRSSPVAAPGFDELYIGADGVTAQAALDAVDSVVASTEGTLELTSDRVASLTGQIDSLLIVIFVLLGLTLLIALIGIVNTTVLSTLERTREFGVIRAVGTTRGQLRAMVRRETVAITVYGSVLGIIAGLALGLGLTAVMPAEAGPTPLEVPWLEIAVIAVIAVVAGVLAAYFPARRASRLDVLDAIRTS